MSSAPNSFVRSRCEVVSRHDVVEGRTGGCVSSRGGDEVPDTHRAVSESTTTTGHVSVIDFAATCADCMVADSFEERLMHTMPSAPSPASRRKAVSNAPAEGAAVSGSFGALSNRRQNSAAVSSLRSTSSSLPKRIVSGTISIPSCFDDFVGQVARTVRDHAYRHVNPLFLGRTLGVGGRRVG